MTRVGIIGGGVIGLCAGISLRTRGFDVTIVDDTAGPPGASTWNCGWLGGIALPPAAQSREPPPFDPLAPVAQGCAAFHPARATVGALAPRVRLERALVAA